MTDVSAGTEREGESDHAPEGRGSAPRSNLLSKATEGRIVRGTRSQDIAVHERKNWLIHLHYIRKDFETCKVLIGELLQETEGMCEYAIYVLGLIKRQEGDILDSLELFQRAVTLNPNSTVAVKQVARSLFLLGKHKTALDTYNEALTLSPQEWEIYHNMGVCCIYLKDYDQAVERFTEAVRLSPQSTSYIQLGRVHLIRSELAKATDIYKTAVEHNPDDPDLLATLGLLYMEMGETKKAFESLGSALTFDPSNAKAILAAGAMIQDHGDYDVALSKYRVAAAATPESPQLWNNIGMCLFGKQKHVAAISCLKRATYLAPFEWKALYNLGLIHLTLHQYASAYHFLRAAVAINQHSGQVFMLLAVALTHLKDYENACKSYEQAIKLDRDNPMIRLNYAILLYNNGEKRAAGKQFQLYKSKLQTHKPPNPDPEMESVAARLGSMLQLGDEQQHGSGDGGSKRRVGSEKMKDEEDSLSERQRKVGNSILWEEDEEDYQEPDDAIPYRERRLTSWF